MATTDLVSEPCPEHKDCALVVLDGVPVHLHAPSPDGRCPLCPPEES